ncbi:hypothetical protein SAMN05421810_10767 [Amycolatopsis arida]|uniref:Uncharacterized protein n=1 Tax=Amycolatopsis arida TaxID=587909 RepID=A0A1I5YCF6_9PSEU|nr:hypothetical protein CLV69_10767 [Amycolatopsis arida]SFQ41915.1 hypothetical protein SAMN05421810_10767 [Amycolatopsis arida]
MAGELSAVASSQPAAPIPAARASRRSNGATRTWGRGAYRVLHIDTTTVRAWLTINSR